MKKEKIKFIVIAILILASGLIYSFFLSENKGKSGLILETENLESVSVSLEDEIYVYVCGQVEKPGVYLFKTGDRVCNAIEKAGGITSDGNIENINLADVLVDGQMIKIMSVDEITVSDDDGLVNINTATKEVLMSLPGIGETKAQGIITFRESSGSFSSIEDIMNVEGIKESLFSKIKEFIKV